MLEIGTKKVSKNEARDLYDCLIKLDVDTLKKSTSRNKDKRNNILTILSNIEMCVFDDVYFSLRVRRKYCRESKIKKT